MCVCVCVCVCVCWESTKSHCEPGKIGINEAEPKSFLHQIKEPFGLESDMGQRTSSKLERNESRLYIVTLLI